jgi:F-type H+-transporting ATPase subunit epsilon
MPKNFKIDIMTPEARLYKGEAYSLVVPAALGYLGVLADHAPIVAKLKVGKIIIKASTGDQKVINNKGKGFLEAGKNKAVILLESAE